MGTIGTRRGIKVLVVDDDTDTTMIVSAYLKGEGFTPSAVANGAQALEWIDKYGHPDVILLDLGMPVMNGTEFMAEYNGPAPIIIATGWDSFDLPSKPFDILHKPITCNTLVHAIESAIESARSAPKWARLLPCEHSCVALGFMPGGVMTLECYIPGCHKRREININKLDFETVAELTLAIAEDTLSREDASQLS